MGRGRGRGKGKGRGGGGRGGGRSRDAGKSGWGDDRIEMTNHKFEAYYYDQKILSTPTEWSSFLESLRQPLPTTFRITAGLPQTSQIQNQMISNHLPTLSSVIFESSPVPAPIQLPWYPNQLAWSIDVKKAILRKNHEFKKFQRFLVSETEVGNISRQEAVSMLPPLFLDVKDFHLVLDMCASPGSKTAQIVEMLHGATGLGLKTKSNSNQDEEVQEGYNPNPKGFVIANDSDTKRAHMLVHQSSRLPSPNLLVTNLDASAFPKMEVPWLEKGKDQIQTKSLLFDRILADVPCSGDGTLRKNVGIWKDWGIGNGNGLHNLQLRILLRGLALLRPGGRLVYSTCSMNPIENEAVISAALRECGAKASSDSESVSNSDSDEFKGGNVRLLDCSHMLPDLKRRKGLTSWKVSPWKQKSPKPNTATQSSTENVATTSTSTTSTTDSDSSDPKTLGTEAYRNSVLPEIDYVSSHQELQTLDSDLAGITPKSMWPNGNEFNLGLENCIRVYPQDQNTGAFFVAVLEKKSTSKSQKDRENSEIDEKEIGLAYGMARAVLEREKKSSNEEEVEKEKETIQTGNENGDTEMNPGEKSKGKRAASPTLETNSAPDSKKNKAETTATISSSSNEISKLETNADTGHGLSGGIPYKEDPFCYTSSTNSEVMICKEHFKLKLDSFPSHNLLVRNSKNIPLRSIYLTSDSVHALIAFGGLGPIFKEKKNPNKEKEYSEDQEFDSDGDAISRHPFMNPIKLRLLSAGTKLFARQSSTPAFDASLNCKWRATSDGLMALRPFIQDSNILKSNLNDLKFLIKTHYSMIEELPEGNFKELTKVLLNGSFIVDVEESECILEKNEQGRTDRRDFGKEVENLEGKKIKLEAKLTVPVWRAPTSINLMLDKQEKSALSLRLFGVDLTPNKMAMPRGKNAAPEPDQKVEKDEENEIPAMENSKEKDEEADEEVGGEGDEEEQGEEIAQDE